jgi:hypothetical protein
MQFLRDSPRHLCCGRVATLPCSFRSSKIPAAVIVPSIVPTSTIVSPKRQKAHRHTSLLRRLQPKRLVFLLIPRRQEPGTVAFVPCLIALDGGAAPSGSEVAHEPLFAVQSRPAVVAWPVPWRSSQKRQIGCLSDSLYFLRLATDIILGAGQQFQMQQITPMQCSWDWIAPPALRDSTLPIPTASRMG